MTTVATVAAVLLVLFFVVAAAFFSGAETGAYVVNRLRLRIRAQAGLAAAIRLRRLLEDPRALITTTLVGNNLAVFAVSTLVARLLEGRVAPVALIDTLIVTPVLFVFGDVVPKNLFRRYADVLMPSAGRWLAVARSAFSPVVFVLNRLSGGRRAIERRLPADPLHSRDRVLSLVALGGEEGILTPYQQDMASNILRASSVTVRDVMIPLSKVVTVRAPVNEERLRVALAASNHARYPILNPDGDVDSFVDVVACLTAVRAGQPTETAVHPILRLLAGMPVPRALDTLQEARHPVGLVVDHEDRPLGISTSA